MHMTILNILNISIIYNVRSCKFKYVFHTLITFALINISAKVAIFGQNDCTINAALPVGLPYF